MSRLRDPQRLVELAAHEMFRGDRGRGPGESVRAEPGEDEAPRARVRGPSVASGMIPGAWVGSFATCR